MTYANIVITGFMGTGKSTVSPVVAEKMGRRFVDADTVLVERAGKSIPEVFEQDGEPAFRKLEAEVCVDLAAQTELVIATGGGALLNPDTLAAMSSTGMVVCLVANESVLEERLTSEERAGRPMAKRDWRALYHKRKPGYDVIPYQIDVNNKTPEQIAEEIIALWQSVFG